MPWALKALFGRKAYIFNTHQKNCFEIGHDSVVSNPMYFNGLVIDVRRTTFIKVLIQ